MTKDLAEREEYIRNLYEKLAEAFTKSLESSNKDIIKEAYILYLHEEYDAMFAKYELEDFDMLAEICKDTEKEKNFSQKESDVMAWLFPDRKFLELYETVVEIAGIAEKKKKGEECFVTLPRNRYEEKVYEKFHKVPSDCKYQAERLLAKALIDIAEIYDE